jgi:ATP-binding cassette subfamily B (MDR/TAP) protein 6
MNIQTQISQDIRRHVEIAVFEHLTKLDYQWHLSKKSGETLGLPEKAAYAVVNILDFVQIMPGFLDFIVALIFLFSGFDAWSAMIILTTIGMDQVLTYKYAGWMKDYDKKTLDHNADQSSKALDSLLNFEAVKSFAMEDYEVNRYRKGILEREHTNFYRSTTSQLASFGFGLIEKTGLLIGYLLIAYRVSNQTMSPGHFILFSTYLDDMTSQINRLFWYFQDLQRTSIDLEKASDLLLMCPKIQDNTDATELNISNGHIQFKDVNFGYQGEQSILKNISFEIKSGQTIGVVGCTGSGKSTLIRLLLRFFDVDKGSIEIDGQNIKNVAQNSLRKHLGIVPQDIALFNDSIKANIEYAKPGASIDEIIEATTLAGIHEKILTFPGEYDAVVGERGLKLSGGEKQRIAIARAILRNPKIILLDEATSALDTTTEKFIQSGIKEIFKNRTTMIVAHRLSTIMDADLILVLKDGEIIEQGSHNQLLSQNGAYEKLWNQQVSKPIIMEDVDNPSSEKCVDEVQTISALCRTVAV